MRRSGDLDGPVVRITTPHIPLPAAEALEDMAIPSVDQNHRDGHQTHGLRRHVPRVRRMAGQSVLDVLDLLNLGLRRPRHFYMTGLRPPPKAETTSRVFLRFVVLVVLLIAVAAAIWTTVTLDRIELIEDVALEDLENDTVVTASDTVLNVAREGEGRFPSCCFTISMWPEGSPGTEWWQSRPPGFR